MPTRRILVLGMIVAGSVVSLGGLLRIFGEVAGRLFETARPRGLDAPGWIGLGLSIGIAVSALGVALLLVRRYGLAKAIVVATHNVRSEDGPQSEQRVPRRLAVLVLVLGSATVVALVLPGPVGAAVAIVGGLVLRMVAIVVAATSA